jgi:hypothetical protein
MDSAVKGVGRFWVDASLPNEAAKGRLNVAGRTAEAIVKVEVAKSSIEIVSPQQAYHAPAEP